VILSVGAYMVSPSNVQEKRHSRPSQPTCSECGGSVIEYDAAAGNGFCVACGTVVEENTIVSEVTFGEASSGAAIVQGSYVGQGSSRWSLYCDAYA
jgi:ribosomal protein S27E